MRRGNYVITIMAIFIVIALFLSSCIAREASSSRAVEQGKQQIEQNQKSISTARESWEIEWVKTIEAARKEERVVMYTGGAVVAIKEASNLVKQKYGIAIDAIGGRGPEMTRKLFTERANGLFVPDILMLGMNTMLGEAKPAGILDPLEPALILPEVIDPKGWIGGELPWGDKDRMIFTFLAYSSSPIGINVEMVRADAIKSYSDFLAPKWKGKIMMNDPTVSGGGFNDFSSLIYNKVLDLDYFRQLVLQQPVIVRDQRLQVDWLARGKYPVALWPQSAPLLEYKAAGAPVAFIPTLKEGTALSAGGGCLSLINRAPHPNAARVFINWLLSREGQIHMHKSYRMQSARVDIPTEGPEPLQLRRPGEKYFMSANSVEEWLAKDQDRYMEMSRQVFSSLVK